MTGLRGQERLFHDVSTAWADLMVAARNLDRIGHGYITRPEENLLVSQYFGAYTRWVEVKRLTILPGGFAS